VRISEMEQGEYLEGKMKEICATTDVPGTNVVLEGEIGRPPMEHNDQTKSLLHIIKDVGEEIGVKISGTATGGGGDASFTAATGVATVDGLGPVGGNAHSDKEYLEIDTLPERTLLLAMTIDRLSSKI
jgi:glutamate carboxypeptidase